MKYLVSSALLLAAAVPILAGSGGQPGLDVQGPPTWPAKWASTRSSIRRSRSTCSSATRRAATCGSATTSASEPVVLVLAYYRCPMLCKRCSTALLQSLRDMPFNAGEQFEVVTVSFDARETPELAAAKKAATSRITAGPGPRAAGTS